MTTLLEKIPGPIRHPLIGASAALIVCAVIYTGSKISEVYPGIWPAIVGAVVAYNFLWVGGALLELLWKNINDENNRGKW